MIGSVLPVVKPPPARASLAAKLTAATTDGSSTTIGTRYSLPLIEEIGADAQRQAVAAHHVFDHFVGLRHGEPFVEYGDFFL